MESLFIEINFRNRKWLLCGAYIPHKHLVPSHLEKISYTSDLYLAKYDNLLIMGDFNTEVTEPAMKDFCDTYQFKNLVNPPPPVIKIQLTLAVLILSSQINQIVS